MKRGRITPHTSEVGLEAAGRDLPELFRNAAGGRLFFYQLSPLTPPLPKGERKAARPGEGPKEIRVQLAGDDVGDLLILWLNELAFLIQTKRFRPCEMQIDLLTETELSATLLVSLAPPQRDLAIEVKSATRTGALVEKTKGGWSAKVILDV